MLKFSILHFASIEERARVRASAIEDARADTNYLVFVIASCAIATFGLLENSAAVIIGAMIIAPLMLPIESLAFSVMDGMPRLFWRSLGTLALGILIAILLSAGIETIVRLASFGSEIIGRTRPTLLDLGVAMAAGAIGGFAKIKPGISNTIAGTAIAVAVMPPLCVVGLSLARYDVTSALGAFLLFVTNLLGIALACMLVFLVAGYADFARARPALFTMIGLTLLIAVPLGVSLRELLRESAVEATLRSALTHNTVTFRHAELVSSRFDWLSQPPTVTMLVRSSDLLSPHQVSLLEAFSARTTGQHFRFLIDVTPVTRVTATGYEVGPSTPTPTPTASGG